MRVVLLYFKQLDEREWRCSGNSNSPKRTAYVICIYIRFPRSKKTQTALLKVLLCWSERRERLEKRTVYSCCTVIIGVIAHTPDRLSKPQCSKEEKCQCREGRSRP